MKKWMFIIMCFMFVACQNNHRSLPGEKNTQEEPIKTEQATREEIEEDIEEGQKEPHEIIPWGEKIKYAGDFIPNQTDQEILGFIYPVENKIPDLESMELYTYSFFYDKGRDVNQFIFFPRYQDMEIKIYRLAYDSKENKMMPKEGPMFEHKMKQGEVFVLSYLLREENPMIMVEFCKENLKAQWIPMGETDYNLPKDLWKI